MILSDESPDVAGPAGSSYPSPSQTLQAMRARVEARVSTLTVDELRAGVSAQADAERAARHPADSPASPPRELPLDFLLDCLAANALGDGLAFAALHSRRFVCDRAGGSRTWMVFDGHRWRRDSCDAAKSAVDDVAAQYLRAAGICASKAQGDAGEMWASRADAFRKRAARLRSSKGRSETLDFAEANPERPLAIDGEQGEKTWDSDPYLLGVQNGVIDLRLGTLRPGRPEDYVSRAGGVSWQELHADGPLWSRFLAQVTCGRPALEGFLQRWAGYVLTGLVNAQVLVFFHGPGANGKSVFLSLLGQVLGDYARPIMAELLLDQGRVRNSSGPSPDIMALRGIRLGVCSETPERVRFDGAKVKLFVSEDRLVGRNPNDKYETAFTPSHKLALMTNHRPSGPTQDPAFWRRVLLVPWEARFVEPAQADESEHRYVKDPAILDKLRGELPAILAWAVRGCMDYLRDGLQPPPEVLAATREYQDDEDLLGAFLAARCVIEPQAKAKHAALFEAFKEWFEEAGHGTAERCWVGSKSFAQWLKKDGRFQHTRSAGSVYKGLRLVGESDKPTW